VAVYPADSVVCSSDTTPLHFANPEVFVIAEQTSVLPVKNETVLPGCWTPTSSVRTRRPAGRPLKLAAS
jgi:hypothetical protein